MNKVREGYKMTELGEIPKAWDIKTLKEICYIKGRIGWQGLRKEEFISEGPYLITGVNFDRGRIIWNECYHITEERYEQAPEIQLKTGDVLMTKDGTIGKLLYVDDLPGKASLNSHLFVMRPIDNNFVSKYFYYNLQSQVFKKYVDNNKTGSTMPAITQAAMEKYKLPLPSIKEQQKIALILSTVDEQIDNVDELIEKNKKLKKGLMQTLLTKGIGHTKFKKTEIGEIPEEWQISNMEKVVQIRSGNSPSDFELNDSGEYPFFKVDDMNYTSKYLNNAKVYFNSCKYELMDKGMVVFPKRGASIFTNKVAILGRSGYFDTNTMGLKCLDNLSNEYLFYQLKFIGLDKFADTTAVPQINNKHINPLIIPLPTLEEQNRIVEILSEIDKKIGKYENMKQKLEELKKGLMQQLLTGMIRVTV